MAVFLFLIGVTALIYPTDLRQKNPETIFFTGEGIREYKEFLAKTMEKHSFVIRRKGLDRERFYLELAAFDEICQDPCEIITQKKLNKSQTKKVASAHDILHLETDDFSAAIVIDNIDVSAKMILEKMEGMSYWNDPNLTSFAGMPYTNYLLDKYSLSIQEKLFPIMFILGLIICYVFIGNVFNALIAYLPCLFSAGLCLTTLKLMYSTMNMVTSIIPLIVFTVTLSLSFHIYFSYIELRDIKKVFVFKKVPIFLMVFTTYIGFLSLAWAKIAVIKTFGLVCSHMVLLATLFTIVWYWALKEKIKFPKNAEKSLFRSQFFEKSFPVYAIVLLSALAIFSAVVIPSKLKIITDATHYFPKETKLREKILEVTATVSGMPIMEVVVDLGSDLDYPGVMRMEELELKLKLLNLSQKYNYISNNELIRKANEEYSGNFELPKNMPSYLLLRSQLPLSLQESYPIERYFRISFLGQPMNVADYQEDLNRIQNIFEGFGSPFQINGIHHNLMKSQQEMINVLTESFLSSALIVFLFSAFFLRTWTANLIFIFVSLLPVALTFLFMYIFNFSINIATVMTFSISLGLLGDSSFHIIYGKTMRFKNFGEYHRGVLSPVIGTGLLLFLCFGIFSFNSFLPIKQFGGILAFILMMGTIVDLYVLPTLLYKSRWHKKAYEEPLN
jgi:predicted RND superfamily exporter protein